MNPSTNCPVIREAHDILSCEEELTRKMRHFRSTLKRCRRCPLKGNCEGLKMVDQAIDQALRQVIEEWGL